MSRSIIIPALGLAGIIIYGATQASSPEPERVAPAPIVYESDTYTELPPPTRPPPAPRLRSELEAEARRAMPTDTARGLAADTAQAGPVLSNDED